MTALNYLEIDKDFNHEVELQNKKMLQLQKYNR